MTQLFLVFVVGTREATLAGSRERSCTSASLSATELWVRPLPGGRVDDAASFCSPAFKHLMNVQAAFGDASHRQSAIVEKVLKSLRTGKNYSNQDG